MPSSVPIHMLNEIEQEQVFCNISNFSNPLSLRSNPEWLNSSTSSIYLLCGMSQVLVSQRIKYLPDNQLIRHRLHCKYLLILHVPQGHTKRNMSCQALTRCLTAKLISTFDLFPYKLDTKLCNRTFKFSENHFFFP